MMTPEHQTTELVPSGAAVPASPLPVFSGEQMAAALTEYRKLQRALDDSMPDQIMEIGQKRFRKKGYWRAIAVAFNLTVEPIDETRQVDGTFGDGRENFGYVVTYRAVAPNGRAVTGDGSCFAVEKARKFRCPHPEREGSRRTLHYPSEACPDFDSEYVWRALSPEATAHNVRSHAHTRAYNRAVSNLVGFGEVSAEEIDRNEESGGGEDKGTHVDPPRRKSQGSAAKKITDAQVQLLHMRARKVFGEKDGEMRLHEHLREKFEIGHVGDLAFDDVNAVLEWLSGHNAP